MDQMSVGEPDSNSAHQLSPDGSGGGVLHVLGAIAFFTAAGVAMVGWIGFLVWITLTLSGV